MLIEFEKELEKWIFETFEEEMFDDEIVNLYFVIVEENSTYHLELTGSEEFSLGDFDYVPRCGEYFFCEYDLTLNEFINIVNYSLKNIIKNNYFKKIIKNKNIYLIKLQEKIINKLK